MLPELSLGAGAGERGRHDAAVRQTGGEDPIAIDAKLFDDGVEQLFDELDIADPAILHVAR